MLGDSAMKTRMRSASAGNVTGVILLALSLLAGLLLRFQFAEWMSLDYARWLYPWINFIQDHGYFGALRFAFTNYAPAYVLLLTSFVTLLPHVPPILIPKLISLPFELVSAIGIAQIVAFKHRANLLPQLAFSLVWLWPTVIINGAVWGQADAIYASFIVWCVWALCSRRFSLAVALFALSFAFKLQALFFAPLIGMLVLRRVIPWRALLWVPVAFAGAALPAIMVGAAPDQALGAYALQIGSIEGLSMNAPSIFAFMPLIMLDPGYALFLNVGLAACAVFVGAFALRMWRVKPHALQQPLFILSASVVLLLGVPFWLPRMHERYFYAGELLAIALAMHVAWFWVAAILAEIASLNTYLYAMLNQNWLSLRASAVAMGAAFLAACVNWVMVSRHADVSPNAVNHAGKPLLRSPEVWASVVMTVLLLVALPVGAWARTNIAPARQTATFTRDAGDQQAHLEGATAWLCPGYVRVDLDWVSVKNVPASVSVFVHAFNADGERIAVADGILNDGRMTFADWRAPLAEQRYITPTQAASTTEVHLGLYDRDTLQRFRAVRRDSAEWPDNTVILPVQKSDCVEQLDVPGIK
jgi:Gpi18-like mannosyltransferase